MRNYDKERLSNQQSRLLVYESVSHTGPDFLMRVELTRNKPCSADVDPNSIFTVSRVRRHLVQSALKVCLIGCMILGRSLMLLRFMLLRSGTDT